MGRAMRIATRLPDSLYCYQALTVILHRCLGWPVVWEFSVAFLSMSLSWTTFSFIFSILLAYIVLVRNKKKNGPYPPGPKPLPVIGNMLDFPTSNQGEVYMSWSKKYNSDIVFASAFGTNILVLNKKEDADELFDRRARIYSGRPIIPTVPLLGWEGMVSLLPYGNYWRLCRKICQQHFNKEAARKYEPIIQEKVHKLLVGLLEDPQNFAAHNKMVSTSITLAMMCGYQVKTIEDPLVTAADQMLSLGGSVLTHEGSLINIFPVLRFIPPWFPGASSRRIAARARDLSSMMQRTMANFLEKSMADGTAVPSLMSDFGDTQAAQDFSEEKRRAIADVAFTTYSAASDTTISATSTFFYLMAVNPTIQKIAQQDIDRIIGSSRLPDFADRRSLPYIDAIYREVMRYQQSLHLGAPHAASEADFYKGYLIPKGTLVIGNIWAMTHNEDIYPDPYSFVPERHLQENGELCENGRIFAYGYGRRICVGKHVASSILWKIMASVLACYDISKEKDEQGNEIEVNDEYITDGLLTHKRPFKCSIKPRSPICKELISELQKSSL